jgi:DHA2 family multidrug resistance protein
VIRELKTASPVVNLRIFKVRTYATGVFLMTALGFVLYGSLVALPLFLQVLLGYPAVQAGIAMMPRGIGSFVGMPLVGAVMTRLDPRKLLAVGLVGASFTLIALSRLNLNAGYWDLFWPQIWQGLSMSLLFVPLTTISMDPIPKEEMGNATSMFNFMRNIGGSLGIATATTVIARDSQRFVNILGAHVSPYRPEAQQMMEGLRQGFIAHGASPAVATQRAYGALFGMVGQQATLLSYLDTFRFFGVIFLAVLPFIVLMRRPAHTAGTIAAH